MPIPSEIGDTIDRRASFLGGRGRSLTREAARTPAGYGSMRRTEQQRHVGKAPPDEERQPSPSPCSSSTRLDNCNLFEDLLVSEFKLCTGCFQVNPETWSQRKPFYFLFDFYQDFVWYRKTRGILLAVKIILILIELITLTNYFLMSTKISIISLFHSLFFRFTLRFFAFSPSSTPSSGKREKTACYF